MASVVLRVRFWFTPLTADEAGARLAAQSWARGDGLYTDLFIDRPQGFIAMYQRWEALVGSSDATVRMLGSAAGVVLVVATALAARTLGRSATAGAAAAVLAAVFSSAPAIEGHTANAELLAAAVGASAVAIAAPFVVGRAPAIQLAGAGLVAATAITVKQSAFDALAALVIWLLVAAWLRWRPRRELAAATLALGAGAVTVAVVTLAHGATFGWDAYRYALFDFRREVRSTVAGARWSRLASTGAIAAALVAPAIVLAVRNLRATRRPWRWTVGPAPGLVLIWGTVGAAGLLAGGNYHRHYWVQLVPAISVGLALSLSAGSSHRPSPALVRRVAAAVALPLVSTLVVIVAPGIERSDRIDADEAVAAWYLDHRTQGDGSLLALCAGATTYAAAGVAPPYPYLWVDHVRSARGAQRQLEALLGSSDRPSMVAVYDRLDPCDPDGFVVAALEQGYEPVTTVDDVTIWRADEP